MSQHDIVQLLLKKKEPLTSKEIAQLLSIRQESIIRSLKKLLRYNEVQARKMTVEEKKERNVDIKNKCSRFRVFWIEN